MLGINYLERRLVNSFIRTLILTMHLKSRKFRTLCLDYECEADLIWPHAALNKKCAKNSIFKTTYTISLDDS